jgi:ubiquinone biosynthesis protein
MKFFDKTLKNMNRFREILSVLIKYGFGELLDRSGLTRIARIKSSSFIKLKTEHLTVYQRISLAFQDLGPAFVKLGQIMAEREDVFPLALCKEFKKLQTSAKEISFDAALDVIKTELNADASDIFDKLYEKPVASASIAQVHRAMLKNGKMAAVKIQRPNIAAVISIDMDIIAYIAGILEHNDPSLTAIELKSMILRFAESIKKELDFENERKNIERFKSNFTKNKDIYIPKVSSIFQLKNSYNGIY